MSYADLEAEESNPVVQLNLCRIERYLNGPPTAAQAPLGKLF